MRRPWWLILVLVALIGASPLSPSDSDTLDRNRQRLDRWRAEPERYRQLLADLRDFFALPPDRQQQLREVDAKLHALGPTRQARLWTVLERYDAWLDELPEAARRRVLDAATATERLAVIRALREQEWVDRQPKLVRAELAKLSGEARSRRVAALREEARQARVAWFKGTAPPPRPARFSDLPPDVQRFVKDDLTPVLPREDADTLKRAEGNWPEYPRAILDLTERYLVHRPGEMGVIKDVTGKQTTLPPALNRALTREKRAALLFPPHSFALAKTRGKWPDHAEALANAAQAIKLNLPPLGACRLTHFPAQTQAYVRAVLYEKLTAAEKASLTGLEGKWPDYPRRLVELGRQKGLTIPGVMVPGPTALWDAARAGP